MLWCTPFFRLEGVAEQPFIRSRLLLGEATAGGFWLVVDWLAGERGNMITVM